MKIQRTPMAIIMAGLLLTTLLISGCQSILVTRTGENTSGEIETRQFDFTEFSRLEIGSAYSYEIKQSDTYSISITASDNLFDDIKVAKEGQTLEVSIDLPKIPWAVFNIGPSPKVVITMPQLYGLNSSGATNGIVSHFSSTDDLDFTVSGASSVELVKIVAGDVSFQVSGASTVFGDIKAKDIDFEVSGASTVSGDVKVGDIDLDVSGASSVQLEGSANDTEIEASGASRLNLVKLTVKNANVTLSGASDGTVNLNGRLDAKLSGASTLEYIGEPTLGKMDITGASTLKKK